MDSTNVTIADRVKNNPRNRKPVKIHQSLLRCWDCQYRGFKYCEMCKEPRQ